MGCGRGGSWIQEELGGNMGEMSLIKVYCMYKFPKKLKECYILKISFILWQFNIFMPFILITFILITLSYSFCISSTSPKVLLLLLCFFNELLILWLFSWTWVWNCFLKHRLLSNGYSTEEKWLHCH